MDRTNETLIVAVALVIIATFCAYSYNDVETHRSDNRKAVMEMTACMDAGGKYAECRK